MATFDSTPGIYLGSHLFHIQGYSCTKQLPVGYCLKLERFKVGGAAWCVLYYPRGCGGAHYSKYTEYLSFFVALDGLVPWLSSVKARCRFSLLDRAGQPVPAYVLETRLNSFCAFGDSLGFADFIKREVLEASGHLVDDCFKIRCEVLVVSTSRSPDAGPGPPPPTPSSPPTPPPPPPSDLPRHLGELLKAREGADVAFQVAGETFLAHMCILAARLPARRAEIYGAMRERTRKPICIRIDDMEAATFGALLYFVYTDSLPEMSVQKAVVMAERLLLAAVKYDMPRLKLICEQTLTLA